jgi:transposase
MGRPCSNDLRERVVRAVIKGGLSRHQAAAQFGVSISMAINWVQRFDETDSVKPDQIGGYPSIRDAFSLTGMAALGRESPCTLGGRHSIRCTPAGHD